jgi:hypothetical protein
MPYLSMPCRQATHETALWPGVEKKKKKKKEEEEKEKKKNVCMAWGNHVGSTEKPLSNESEGTKDFVLYSRGFVIAGLFNNKNNYSGT